MAVAVVSCKKYHRRGIKVMDFGDEINTRPEMMKKIGDLPNFECLVCGPCSHTEFNWDGYWTIEATATTVDEAIEKAWELVDRSPNGYDNSGLPPKTQTT